MVDGGGGESAWKEAGGEGSICDGYDVAVRGVEFKWISVGQKTSLNAVELRSMRLSVSSKLLLIPRQ